MLDTDRENTLSSVILVFWANDYVLGIALPIRHVSIPNMDKFNLMKL